jgi:ssDNA-binding Zn-finger/Zn-ribbon topoisomerase 1
MNTKSNQDFKAEKCPKCNNEVIMKEDKLGKTITCLYCGFYQTGSISFFMHLTDVNELRKIYDLNPLTKLIDIRKKS